MFNRPKNFFIKTFGCQANLADSEKIASNLKEKGLKEAAKPEEADWVVTGYISDYNIETSGINGKQASMNRLTVAVEITLKDNKTQKSTDYSVTKSFEFNSSKSLEQAGNELFDDILKGVSDEIFNRLFSNW